jgi:hypothetical protein
MSLLATASPAAGPESRHRSLRAYFWPENAASGRFRVADGDFRVKSAAW